MLSICLWEQRESNPRPSACKADALNQLSYAPLFSFLFANYCVKLHSYDSHVTKYTPVFSFVFLVLDKNKLRNVSYLSFANYCVKLHSCDSHVTKYAPVFSFVFLVLDKNKLRNVSYQKNSSLLGLQMYAIFFILQKKSDIVCQIPSYFRYKLLPFHTAEYICLAGSSDHNQIIKFRSIHDISPHLLIFEMSEKSEQPAAAAGAHRALHTGIRKPFHQPDLPDRDDRA